MSVGGGAAATAASAALVVAFGPATADKVQTVQKVTRLIPWTDLGHTENTVPSLRPSNYP